MGHDQAIVLERHGSPCSRHVVIPDAGHCANQDDPGFFNALLAAFLEVVTGGRTADDAVTPNEGPSEALPARR